MAIPGIVSGTEVSTPSAGVQLDSSAFRQAALAPGKIGAAIGQDVGGVFLDVATKLQANRNYTTAAKADLTMRTAKDDFDQSLAKNPDQGTWVPKWQETASSVRDRVLSDPNVGPDLKRTLSANLDTWEAANTSFVATKARQKEVSDSRIVALTGSTKAYSMGDIAGGDNLLQGAVHNYAMDQAEADSLKSRGRDVAFKSVAADAINTDPIHAPELLEKQLKDKMKPVEFRPLLREAYEAQSRRQTLNARELSEQVALTKFVDPEVLQQKVAAKEITQPQANNLLASVKRYGAEQKKEDIEEERKQYNIALMEADNHDWINDRQPEQSAQQIKAEGLKWTQPALQRILNEHIDAKVKEGKTQGAKVYAPVQAQIFSELKEDMEKRGLALPQVVKEVPGKTHWFKPNEPSTTKQEPIDGGMAAIIGKDQLSDEEIEKNFGKGVTRDQVIEAARSHQAGVMSAMRDWFKQHPKATYDEAQAYRIQIEKPYVMGAVSKALKPTKEAFAPAGKKVKQNGVIYQADGKGGWNPVS